MVHVSHSFHTLQIDVLLEQVFVDVEQAAAGEYLVELVFQQLVHAGPARHDHRFDVEIVQRVRDAMEQHAVVGGDLVGLVGLSGSILRIAAAQVARRQHGDRAGLVQHRLCRQPDLAEQALGTAAREVEHCLAVLAGLVRIADDGHDAVVLDVEQRARGFFRQIARHRFVDEVDHLRFQRCAAHRGRRPFDLAFQQAETPGKLVADALSLVSPRYHHLAHQFDGGRIGGVEKQHRRRSDRAEFFLALLAQEIAHRDRHIAEIDVNRAGVQALVAHGAMVGDIAEFVEVRDRNAAAGLFLVQERLDQQRGAEYLVARRIQQVGARHMGAAHRLALAAAQTVLDRIGDIAQFAFFQDQAFQFHQVKARGIGALQVATAEQLAFVEAAFRVDLLLVSGERGDFLRIEKIEFGDADAVFAGNHPAQVFRQLHDARHRAIGLLQHFVVVRVHRNVGMHVAVPGVHVQRNEHAAFKHALVDAAALLENGLISAAAENLAQRLAHFAFP